jgi:radical SAM protein with 4Fe4S-binding SPASM domain
MSPTTNALPPPPRRLYLDITRSCPLTCRHCYAAEPDTDGPELGLGELADLVRQMLDLGTRSLVVAGGEPLCRSDLLDFLDLCAGAGVAATLVTNGLLLTLPIARELRRLGAAVRVSLDGATAEVHEAVRGPETFTGARRALELLARAGVERRSVHFTVNRINVGELRRLPFLLRELRVAELVVSAIKPLGRTLQDPSLLLDPATVSIVQERIRTLERAPGLRLQWHAERTWEGPGCPAGHVKLGVTAEGRVTPCVFLGRGFVGGSLRQRALRDLWHDDEHVVRARSMAADGPCRSCPAVSTLNGGCRARALYYHGDAAAPDPYCCRTAVLCGLLADEPLVAHAPGKARAR